MSADKDVVLQNFGQASETHFLMFSVLQLILSLENGETDSPYDIDAPSVYTLCLEDERLPANIRSFILWQSNIKQRDNGQILNIEIPHGLCKSYDVWSEKLEAATAAERVLLIQGCLDEIGDYLGKLHGVCAILEAAEDRFNTVEMLILQGHGHSQVLSGSLDIYDEFIEGARAEIEALHAELEGYVMPDLVTFEPKTAQMHDLIRRLSDIHLSARDIIRRYNLGQGDDD